VANASPIIVLAKAGCLELLDQPEFQLLVPDVVVREVLAGPPSDPARRALEAGWGSRVEPGPVPLAVVEWGLGAGESAVLATALAHSGATALLDDAEARRCARTLGVAVLGTLGLVLQAKRSGRIESASAVLRRLRQAGLHLDDPLVQRVLAEVAGEVWEPAGGSPSGGRG
jgi:predicted nucleic acid-binding protein